MFFKGLCISDWMFLDLYIVYIGDRFTVYYYYNPIVNLTSAVWRSLSLHAKAFVSWEFVVYAAVDLHEHFLVIKYSGWQIFLQTDRLWSPRQNSHVSSLKIQYEHKK